MDWDGNRLATYNPADGATLTGMSVTSCTTHCFEANADFAAVGDMCYCSNAALPDDVESKRVNENQCNAICEGVDDQICGGVNRVSFYKVNHLLTGASADDSDIKPFLASYPIITTRNRPEVFSIKEGFFIKFIFKPQPGTSGVYK